MRNEGRRTDQERERQRLYNLGALAQSYVPRGVADLLNLSAAGRARARADWRARPRHERIGMYAVLGIELAGVGVLIWGVTRRDGVMVLAAGGALVGLMLGTVVLSIVAELRRAKAGRKT